MSTPFRTRYLACSCLPAACLIFISCATITAPQPPSLELPKAPTDLRAVRKGDKVLLSWTQPTVTTDRQNLRKPGPVLVCREIEPAMKECGAPVGRAAPATAPNNLHKGQKISDSYTDVLPVQLIPATASPSAFVTYAVEVLNADGRGAGLSNQVRVPLAQTLPAPHDFAATLSDQGVVLTWTVVALPRGSDQAVHYMYRVYRRREGTGQQLLVGELTAAGEKRMSFTDSNMEWEQTYFYHVEAVTVIDQVSGPELQIEGDDSAEVKVFAHDIFPPSVPSGLQAVFSGPGQTPFIDLIWAPITDADLAGYNVYRREANGMPVRVNADLITIPAYRDAKVTPGKTYFYSISSVDLRGNESAKSAEASESVPVE